VVTGIIRAVTQPYPPPQFAPQPPPHPRALPGYARPPRPRGAAGPLVAGLSGLLAAGLVLGGSFPAIHTVDRGDSDVVIKWWGVEGVELSGDAASLRGLPLVLAVLLLGAGAILAFTRKSTATRLLLALGLGSLTGTVFLQVIATLHDLSAWNKIELAPGESIQFVTGLGLWLPMAGILVGAVALIFAYRGPRAGVELSTPRMGFPMPYPPGPMTGMQPAVPSGQPMPGAPVVAAPGAAAAAAVAPPAAPAPASSASTSDDDPETTLRTKVTEEPAEAPAPASEEGTPVAPDAPTDAPEPETPDVPTESADTPAEAPDRTDDDPEESESTEEPAAPDATPPSEPDTAKADDLPAAPPAPELAAEPTPEPAAAPTPEPTAKPAPEDDPEKD
jgi:hypothetical protein